MTIKLLACSGSLDGGGSERQLWQLVSNLPAADFASELFLIYKRGPFLERLPPGLPVHAFYDGTTPSQRFSLPGSIHRAQVSFVKQLIEKRAIQIVYDRTFHMTLITSKACKLARCPRISVIVSPPSFDFARSNERFKGLKYRILRGAYGDPAAVTVCVSDAVAEDAASFYRLPITTFRVIPSPVDIAGIKKLSEETEAIPGTGSQSFRRVSAQHHAGSGDSFRVVVVGRMTAEKGHATMIEAVQAWNCLSSQSDWMPLQVEFIGEGPLQAELQRQAEKLGVSDQIHFRGFQANPYPWIAIADVVCIPSTYEGLPNVALEALALKRPLIATRSSSSLQSLIGPDNERGQLMDVGDSRAIAQALLSLRRDRHHWQMRSDSGFEWVEREHSLESWIRQMSQLFCQLAGSK